MVSPLDNVRPTTSSQPGAARSPRGVGGDFGATLANAVARGGSGGGVNAPPVLGDDVLANLEQVTQGLRRAHQHISSARAHYRAAGESAPSALDARG